MSLSAFMKMEGVNGDDKMGGRKGGRGEGEDTKVMK